MDLPEALSAVHGLFATLFLMGFAGAFAELVEVTNAGVRRIKWGISLMTLAVVLIISSGLWTYIFYRAPVPTSPRSILKASGTPWVHEIIFELKEHIGTFVPALMIVALYIAFVHADDLQKNRAIRTALAGLLVLALAWTLLTFGFAVYVTKIAPL